MKIVTEQGQIVFWLERYKFRVYIRLSRQCCFFFQTVGPSVGPPYRLKGKQTYENLLSSSVNSISCFSSCYQRNKNLSKKNINTRRDRKLKIMLSEKRPSCEVLYSSDFVDEISQDEFSYWWWTPLWFLVRATSFKKKPYQFDLNMNDNWFEITIWDFGPSRVHLSTEIIKFTDTVSRIHFLFDLWKKAPKKTWKVLKECLGSLDVFNDVDAIVEKELI